jgi:hypothetical protein
MFVLVGVIAVVVAFGVAIRQSIERERGPTRAFDAVLWKQADPNRDRRTVRSEMVDDLLDRVDFSGWTRAEILKLLGPSSPSRPASGFDQWDLYYVLGLERGGGFALDDEALGFKFDAAGKVVKFGVSVN